MVLQVIKGVLMLLMKNYSMSREYNGW